MADAKKCDRCGKFYIRDDEITYDVMKYANVGPEITDVTVMDLCPSCEEALDHFMKMEPIDIIEVKATFPITDLPGYEELCGAKHCRPMVHNEV